MIPKRRKRTATPQPPPNPPKQPSSGVTFVNPLLFLGLYKSEFDEATVNIGSGAFGDCHEAYHSVFGKCVIKEFSGQLDMKRAERLYEEGRMNNIFNYHVNVVRYIGVLFNDGDTTHPVGLVLENVTGGTLHTYVHYNVENPSVDPADRIRIQFSLILEMAQGIAYIHRHGLHRDIKPANVLITKHGNVKIADFGFARLFETNRLEYTAGYGTNGFTPPESETSEKSDVFSFAMTVYYILTYKYALTKMTDCGRSESNWQVEVKNGWRPNFPDWTTDANREILGKLRKLVESCWATERDDRLTMFDVIKELEKIQDAHANLPQRAKFSTPAQL